MLFPVLKSRKTDTKNLHILARVNATRSNKISSPLTGGGERRWNEKLIRKRVVLPSLSSLRQFFPSTQEIMACSSNITRTARTFAVNKLKRWYIDHLGEQDASSAVGSQAGRRGGRLESSCNINDASIKVVMITLSLLLSSTLASSRNIGRISWSRRDESFL